jgi:hypothetical protein
VARTAEARRKHYRAKRAAKRHKEREGARAITDAVRADLRGRDDPGWGTSPGALGIVKAMSEESRDATCFECGYSGGRHARMCSRNPG